MSTFVGARRDTDFTGTPTTSLTGAATYAVQTGDGIFQWLKFEGATTTESVGNGVDIFTPAAVLIDVGNGDMFARLFYAIAVSSGNRTATASLGAARPYLQLDTVVGRPAGGTTFQFDQYAYGVGIADTAPRTTVPGGTITPSAANGFAVEVSAGYSPYTWVVGAAFTNCIANSNPIPDSSVAGYRLHASAAAITVDFSVGGASATWAVAGANFIEVTAGSPDNPPLRPLALTAQYQRNIAM